MIIPDKTYFIEATKAVIDNFEGGYYHPKMYLQNPRKFEVMKTSGETMYGLDRHAGFNLYYKGTRKAKNVQDNLKFIESGVYEYKNEASKKFWSLIDSLDAQNNWPYLYSGGPNREKLISYATDIMYPEFLRLGYKYLSEASQKIVFGDPRLLFHFIYATWNGEGFFKFYSNKLNKSIQEAKNLNTLVDEQISLRKNSRYSTIRNTGEKMRQLFKNANFVSTVKNVSKNPFTWILILGIAGLGFYLYNQKQINATI